MSEHEERLREHLGKNLVYEAVLLHDLRAMFCDIDTLRASQNALRADAERYRWLRDKGNWRLYILQLPPRQMDAAIDAARTEGEG